MSALAFDWTPRKRLRPLRSMLALHPQSTNTTVGAPVEPPFGADVRETSVVLTYSDGPDVPTRRPHVTPDSAEFRAYLDLYLKPTLIEPEDRPRSL